ncbi:MAG: serine/threonine protein kinase, partial [Myxococcales bacterium]|nr:serine/threonine protein kinase [Myxococcales bacterium]
GATLRDVIKRGPLPVARAVSIAKQIAAALSATHAVGIVHRDVKPRNVMLIEGGREVVKLIDFGLAKLSVKEVSDVAASRASMTDHLITGTGAIFGTIAYLAPEATLGMDAVDARADLYALGLVMYEMIAGKHPFDTSDPVGLFKHHAKTPPPPIAERSPGVFVQPAVEAVIAKLLAKRRDDRYASADEV